MGISIPTYPSLKSSFRRRLITLNSKPKLQRELPQYALLYPQLICYFHFQDFFRSSLKAIIIWMFCFKALNFIMISTRFLKRSMCDLEFSCQGPTGGKHQLTTESVTSVSRSVGQSKSVTSEKSAHLVRIWRISISTTDH